MESYIDTVSIIPDNSDPPTLNDCWNKIGVMGDRSCGELKTVIHCRNCKVYSAAGRSLLEREAPPEYLQEWTDILSEASTQETEVGEGTLVRATDTLSVIIFRLGNERLALPVNILQEVTPLYTIHTVPHRRNSVFLGLINIRGETLLCISIRDLLGLEPVTESVDFSNSINPQRMIVAGKNENKWVFPVDEVHGTYRFHLNEFKDAPVVISKASEAYTKGVVTWQGKKINFLDSELLFYTLSHKVF
ncbi:chemotaxis protein CheW [Planktothrix paucivesiculata]|uniref:Chemotaxis protein CheW n=1 Tax=Planktothrix paucivesiculata PCC 9631 TaxID=671071 RepID=A0A7Z9BMT0_9CYAN|nr:chemotaxis protein CheW [Planktothrix paucivesiculata]VXD17811.1 putative CheW protein [Planktothrix paucivesiculata PCC 9631]